ncbi:MAG: hypothetical protein EBZ69_09710, partial [Alphaproteobacteria bacterium]|nr:hypothetical protein [Alphaproteobacteria bacterium]
MSAGVKQLDPWQRYYIYCRWQNSPDTPSEKGIKIISAGPDRTLDTACSDTTAQDDDKIEYASVGEVINRANVWQVTSSGDEVKFGLAANPVAITSTGFLNASGINVTSSGPISAGTLTLSGALSAGAMTATTLDLTTALPIAEGGTAATTALGARANLGATTVGDYLFSGTSYDGTKAASARTDLLGATTVGAAVFTATTTANARTTLGSTTVGDAVFTATTTANART